MWEIAVNHLRTNDPKLAEVIQKVGDCALSPLESPFWGLVQAIVSQQLSTKAAITIIGRLRRLFPEEGIPTPHLLLSAPEGDLRGVGLSRQKISYIQGVAFQTERGLLDSGRFRDLTDEEAVRELMKIKGVGRWTAEMFLIFVLARPNVLPVGDLAFQNAVKRVYRLRNHPTESRLLRIGKPWEPYRSVATWYLWALVDNTPGIW